MQNGFKYDSENYQPEFTENEYNVLNLATNIFGSASAKELSEINHTFEFWKEAYENGTDRSGYHNKDASIVDMTAKEKDIRTMQNIISAYKESVNNVSASEIINGIKFYYDGFALTDEMIEQLENFSLFAEDDAYSVYIDDGRLVIY